ncbi:hypothetical protein [Methanosphaera sp.]
MDKKILLSVLIVALIGIIAATYQINIGEEILNPLASVDTEESSITDVLAAPTAAESSNIGTTTDQNAAETAATAATDQANSQATSTSNTSQSGSGNRLITSDNPISAPSTGNDSGRSTDNGTGNPDNDNTGNPQGNPTPNPSPSVDTDPDENDSGNPDAKIIAQYYQQANKVFENLTIDQDSGYLTIENDAYWYVFEAIDQQGETVHVYMPTSNNTAGVPYIKEEGSGYDAPNPEDYESDIDDDET